MKGVENMAEEVRKDPKGRKLRTGETYDEKTGRYRYSANDVTGKRIQLYSWTLTAKDKVPTGKKQKPGNSLREKEDDFISQRLQAVDQSGGNMTLQMLMERYIKLKRPEVRETTRNGYRTCLKLAENDKFCKRKIKTITEEDIILWFDELHEKQGKGYSSLHTLKGVLRPAFTLAKKNRWIFDNPCNFSLNKKRYGGTATREALTGDEMRRYLDFMRTDRHFNKYFDGVYILFNTGLRISEFCGLTVNDIDFKEHVIHVKRQLIRLHNSDEMMYYIEEPKTENGTRDVPMFGDVEKCFKRVIDNRPVLKEEPVIWNADHTESATGFLWFDKNDSLEVAQHWQNHLRWSVNKYNKTYKQELPNITPHVCRHTFCSMCACAGLSPKTLQMIMGHSSIEFTLNVYTHLEAGNIKEQFFNMAQSKQYNFYSLDSAPAVVSLNDDYEEPEPNFDEEADDED